METQELTFGQKLVGIRFNPSELSQVDKAKQLFADLADMVGDPSLPTVERKSWTLNIIRTAAITQILFAQMAVVKYLTWSE